MKTVKKVGIFGGSFNPIHNGHINSFSTVQDLFDLDEVRVIPAFHSPHRLRYEGPDPEQRLRMVELAVEQYDKNWVVDRCEINRQGISYTFDTICELEENSTEQQDLFLIVGVDQFQAFDRWEKFEQILEKVDLIVTTRPGWHFDKCIEDLSSVFKDLIVEQDASGLSLKTGRKVYFIELEDQDISSTFLRQEVRRGKSIHGYVPDSVVKYIEDNSLYVGAVQKVGDFEVFTKFCSRSLFEKKAIDVVGINLQNLSYPSEFVLVASGTSTKHASSLAENLLRQVRKEYQISPQNIEGQQEGKWLLLDYGSLIVHIFYDFTRQEYQIEDLWQDGVNMELEDPFIPKDSANI